MLHESNTKWRQFVVWIAVLSTDVAILARVAVSAPVRAVPPHIADYAAANHTSRPRVRPVRIVQME